MRQSGRNKRRKLLFVVVAVVLIALLLAVSLTYYFKSGLPSELVYKSKPQISRYAIEYATQSSMTTPNSIAVDAHGNIWFALWNATSISELSPAKDTIHEYRIPVPKIDKMKVVIWGLAVDNTRGLVWFTEIITNSIWSFNMSSHQFTQYRLKTEYAFPFGITVDAQNNVWFAEESGNAIGEITPNGTLRELPIPGPGDMEPSGITTDSSGRVWFTLAGAQSIGSYYDGSFHIYNLTGLVNTPVGISFDQDGNIWLTQHATSFISEFNPTTGYFKTISTSNNSLVNSLPYFSWVDNHGDVWFDEHQGNAMGEFIPSNNTLIEYFIPSEVEYAGNISGMLTSAPSTSGEPWYTEFFTGKIGTINTSAPLDLSLRVENYSSDSIPMIANGSQVAFDLNVSALPSAGQVHMHGYIGNFSGVGNFTFTFEPERGEANLVTIVNDGSLPGVYFLTLSALTTSLGVSQIIEVRVP